MKIEIMDLLHKIYNLDDMPRKIIFENCVWRYCSEFQDYQSERGYLFGDYMTHINETRKFLNGEVEIVEEDNKIEKISYDDHVGIDLSEAVCNKLNVVIDAINEYILSSKG